MILLNYKSLFELATWRKLWKSSWHSSSSNIWKLWKVSCNKDRHNLLLLSSIPPVKLSALPVCIERMSLLEWWLCDTRGSNGWRCHLGHQQGCDGCTAAQLQVPCLGVAAAEQHLEEHLPCFSIQVSLLIFPLCPTALAWALFLFSLCHRLSQHWRCPGAVSCSPAVALVDTGQALLMKWWAWAIWRAHPHASWSRWKWNEWLNKHGDHCTPSDSTSKALKCPISDLISAINWDWRYWSRLIAGDNQ